MPTDDKNIFLRALELASPEEREAFLDEACDDDAELRSQVDDLLNSFGEAGRFLETPAVVNQYDLTMTVDNEEPALLDFLAASDAPDSLGRIGQYEVEAVLGRGGAGIVLKAFDPKLKRYVAVKALSPMIAANPVARTRFLREAHATAAVSHPHVATIFAIDEHEKIPFLVMELVDGKTLEQKINEEGCLVLEAILRIGIQIAQGLAAAHGRGLIHRDVKPANILLANSIERVKITDFGLARAVDDVKVTQTGYVGGTPQYMSPEQAAGRKLDYRTDLFSMGSVLYAMCVGRSPFRADSTIAVIRRVCDDTPRPIVQVNPDIPSWLTNAIDRLLAKDPDDRFQSASEFADLVARHMAASPSPSNVDAPPFNADDSNAIPVPTDGKHDTQQIDTMRTPTRTRKPAMAIALVALLLTSVVLSVLELTGATSWHTLFVSPEPDSPQGKANHPAAPSIVHVLTSDEWEWTEPENLGPKINSKYEEGGAQLSADQLTLLFHSTRLGGPVSPNTPDLDLWMSTRSSLDAPFGEPVNLGSPINTGKSEVMPTMSADGLTLVFCRRRVGGFELWMSMRPSKGNRWSKPVSLGSAINGPHYNMHPFLSADGLTLWYNHAFQNAEFSVRMCKRASRNKPWSAPVTLQSGRREDIPFQIPSSGDGLTRILAYDPEIGFNYVLEVRRDRQSPWNEKIALTPLLNANMAGGSGNNWEPFLSADGQTLIYESSRRDGFGDRDLWMIRRVKKK